jgi:hypothetical protein
MPRKSQPEKAFEAIMAEVVFYPNDAQRKCKSDFWAVYGADGMPVENPTMATALDITNETRLPNWWSQPGFKEWFLNKEEYRQRMDYLMHLGFDALERVLRTSQSDTAIVSAMKLLIAANDKMPRQNNVRYADEWVAGLTDQQLEDYINKNLRLVGGPSESAEEKKEPSGSSGD